jgi:hypothetical protein
MSSIWTEIDVYRYDLFARKSGPFRSGRCYISEQHDDGLFWLWLEDLSSLSGSNWTAEQYRLASRSIGQFRAEWLSEDLNKFDWLTRNVFLHSLDSQPVLLQNQKNFQTLRDSEYFRAGLPGKLHDRALGLIEHIPAVVEAALKLPVTLAHTTTVTFATCLCPPTLPTSRMLPL